MPSREPYSPPFFSFVSVVLLAAACGGTPSRLVTVQKPSGAGPVAFEVRNYTEVRVHTFQLAESSRVERAGMNIEPGSPEETQLWGEDLLGDPIPLAGQKKIAVPHPGNWDARATDQDDRTQYITGLRLKAGGTYILELYESGWQLPRL